MYCAIYVYIPLQVMKISWRSHPQNSSLKICFVTSIVADLPEPPPPYLSDPSDSYAWGSYGIIWAMSAYLKLDFHE